MQRRKFLVAGGLLAATGIQAPVGSAVIPLPGSIEAEGISPKTTGTRAFNATYEGAHLEQISFPMGGMGAGMICLDGNGALSKLSLRHRPDLVTEHTMFAAVSITHPNPVTRVLEGPVPRWKLQPGFSETNSMGERSCLGLPRFRESSFESRFPFATVRLRDEALPLRVAVMGWSPFSPGDADGASLPVVALEYEFTNHGPGAIEAVFSFNAMNFMALPSEVFSTAPQPVDRIRSTQGGFVLYGSGASEASLDEGHCAVWVDDSAAQVDHAWFRGSRPDIQMLWNDIEAGRIKTRAARPDESALGASIFVPLALKAREVKTVTVKIAWYVPRSALFQPDVGLKDGKVERYPRPAETYRPWYAGRFTGIDALQSHWRTEYDSLKRASTRFTQTFYDSTLPPEVLEAVAANLSILKSPTVLRQIDGRLWGWEGSNDTVGSCYGSSTHVWNYAQAIAHLFPELERSLRETELGVNQDANGRQFCRVALPIRALGEDEDPGIGFPAADGQLGGILKSYREWRISGDTDWLRRWWPKIQASLDYCIHTWDPKGRGWIEEPHLTTFDKLLWGPDSMCAGLYLGALKAAIRMGQAQGAPVNRYQQLLNKGRRAMEERLFNGEYFIQQTQWKGLQASFPPDYDERTQPFLAYPTYPEFTELIKTEGPPCQFGSGCASDSVFGEWFAGVCGVDEFLDRRKVASHLAAVFRYNFKTPLANQVNLQRVFASDDEAGLLNCTWPGGGRPLLANSDSDEVWTGVEYHFAAHLISTGKVGQGLEIIQACRRRYDGRVRNPFDEVEAGHWYARALASYALLQALSGARFDAVEKILYLNPAIDGDFRCFISTATGYGTVGVRNGAPFLEVVAGKIPYRRIKYEKS